MISSDFNILLAGKKKFQPTWQLTVLVEPVFSIDGELLPVKEYWHRFSENMHSAESLMFEVLYDGTVIGKTNFIDNQKQQLTLEINDTVDLKKHLLEFRLSEKNDNHSYHTENLKDITWVLKYCFFVEDLPMKMLTFHMSDVLKNHVSYVLGQNQSETIVVETPIYSWLIKHSDHIIRDIKEDATGQALAI